MRYTRPFIWTVFTLLLIVPLIALTQADDCTEIVQTALAATNDICETTGRNQACYGHVQLEADAQPGMDALEFSKTGDRVNVDAINSLRLSPMNEIDGSWGVALMRLQADIPDEKPQNVTVLLFGDVQVSNAIGLPTLMDVTAASTGNVNVRRDPDNDAFVMMTLSPDQVVTARGRSEDALWLYIDLPDNTGTGWVSSRLMSGTDAFSTLNVVNPALTEYGPMQAFYLQTGSEESSCDAIPNDGILIQTPEGVAQVRLWINEVRIRLGSTAFIAAGPNHEMTVKTLEGAAHVEAFGVEQVAVAGTSVSIPMNNDNKPSAPPTKPQPYNAVEVNNLPVDNLEREITIEPPYTATDEVQATLTSTSVPATVAPTSTDTSVPTNTDVPTSTNTDVPTDTPTDKPTDKPTDIPTDRPTDVPPTDVPPTEDVRPTDPPTDAPPTEDNSGGGENNDAPPTQDPGPNNDAPPNTPDVGAGSGS